MPEAIAWQTSSSEIGTLWERVTLEETDEIVTLLKGMYWTSFKLLVTKCIS